MLAAGAATAARAGITASLATADAAAAAVAKSVLWNFGATSDDAARPVGGLLADTSGDLYGATSWAARMASAQCFF